MAFLAVPKVSLFGRIKSFWGNSIRRFGMNFWGTGGSMSSRGEQAWLEEAGRNSRLQTPVHTIASDVAVVDWRLQHGSRRKWEDLVEFVKGGSAEMLADLWEKPHPRLTKFDLMYITQYWVEMVGRGAWRMMDIDKAGRPKELWPVPPHWIHRLPSVEDPTFSITFWGDGGPVDVPAEQMIYFVRPSTVDPMLLAQGIAQGVDNEVSLDNAMGRFSDAYFRNFTMLGVILGIPGYDDSKEEIDAAFKEKHAGAENAFKTLIADSSSGNVTATNLAPKLSDLNMAEARKLSRDFIREGWQVPPERCGVIENSNRSTIDGADFFQQSKNVLPRLKWWSQQLDMRLTPLFDNRNSKSGEKLRLRLTFENPVNETADHQLKVTTIGFRAGWLTINEARKRHGEPPVPGGDVFLIPTNNVTAVAIDGDFTAVGRAPKKGQAEDGTT